MVSLGIDSAEAHRDVCLLDEAGARLELPVCPESERCDLVTFTNEPTRTASGTC